MVLNTSAPVRGTINREINIVNTTEDLLKFPACLEADYLAIFKTCLS